MGRRAVRGRDRAQRLLATFGMSAKASSKVEWLSGGEQRRVLLQAHPAGLARGGVDEAVAEAQAEPEDTSASPAGEGAGEGQEPTIAIDGEVVSSSDLGLSAEEAVEIGNCAAGADRNRIANYADDCSIFCPSSTQSLTAQEKN